MTFIKKSLRHKVKVSPFEIALFLAVAGLLTPLISAILIAVFVLELCNIGICPPPDRIPEGYIYGRLATHMDGADYLVTTDEHESELSVIFVPHGLSKRFFSAPFYWVYGEQFCTGMTPNDTRPVECFRMVSYSDHVMNHEDEEGDDNPSMMCLPDKKFHET
jgi:hypothetical protein